MAVSESLPLRDRLSISTFEMQATPIESQCPIIIVPVHDRWGSHNGSQHL